MSNHPKTKTTKASSIWFLAFLLLAAVAYVAKPMLMSAQKEVQLSLEPAQGTSMPPVQLVEDIELPQLTRELPEQIIKHLGYTVSYNPRYHIPNWVAYELTADETEGVEERSNHFRPDPMVKVDPVVTSDYSNSGYDRGHMAPAADMKWSPEAMRESFYMTNICPQLHNLNAGDWKILEERVRSWANEFAHVYVACGPIVRQGYGTIGGERRIAVPAAFFKVILSEKNGDWQAIGFVMNNEAGHKPLSAYVRSVDEIEALTSIDFFYNMPDSIEDCIENSYCMECWNVK